MIRFDILCLILIIPLFIPFIARAIWSTKITWKEMGACIAVTLVLGAATFSLSSYTSVQDTEILNGQITKKYRDRVSCSHSYSCRCRTVSSGYGKNRTTTRVCDTCYEHTADYNWVVNSTVGSFHIARVNRQGTEEPPRFTKVIIGEPAAKEHGYINYVKGAPESLFHLRETVMKKYPPLAYPETHDYYRVNRVINQGAVPQAFAVDLNQKLNELLIKLGPQKQMNLVVVFTKNPTDEFAEALRQQWLGGKKNDGVLVVSTDGTKTNWVRVFSWSKSDMFNVVLRDDLAALPTLTVDGVVASVVNASQHYVRRPMSEFEYLKNEISPPLWLILLNFFLALGASIGITYMAHKEDFFGENHYRRSYY